MTRKHKQYFIFYLKENILIFDVFDYIEELAADYVDYCYEWNIVKNNLVSNKKTIIKGFLETNFVNLGSNLFKMKENLRCVPFFFYNERENLNEWSRFFCDPNDFIKTAKRFLKSRLYNFVEIKEKIIPFKSIKGTYEKIPCLLPTGEDETILTENLKFLKKINLGY
jgi:hypothetical protein